MYPPQQPNNGLYRVKLLSALENNSAYEIRYDIAVGQSVGWATYMYQQTGKWPLVWRLDKHMGVTAIRCALDVLNRGSHAGIQSLAQVAGHHICLELHRRMDAKYIDVRKSLPASAYRITPDDIRIGTKGGWRQGDPNWRHALLLANLSGLPVLYVDSHESMSPMVNWCAAHNIILLPQHFVVGDYSSNSSDVIVDRKSGILELYKDFASSKNRNSYENAAIYAETNNKMLVYVITTSEKEHIDKISDIKNWSTEIRGKQCDGISLEKQLHRHIETFPNVRFFFVKSDQLCETIYQFATTIK